MIIFYIPQVECYYGLCCVFDQLVVSDVTTRFCCTFPYDDFLKSIIDVILCNCFNCLIVRAMWLDLNHLHTVTGDSIVSSHKIFLLTTDQLSVSIVTTSLNGLHYQYSSWKVLLHFNACAKHLMGVHLPLFRCCLSTSLVSKGSATQCLDLRNL